MRITLHSPSDFHTHLRGYNGDPIDYESTTPDTICKAVCALQFPFSQVLAMPNLTPIPIITVSDVDRYRAKLEAFLPSGTTPLMTITLRPETTPEIIYACRGKIASVKYYPKGVTTNSSGGYPADISIHDTAMQAIVEAMIECGIVLCLHPETTIAKDEFGQITKGFVHRAEREFRSIAEEIAIAYPDLKIVIEHISTREMAELVASEKYPNLYGTVTPQHLLLTAHDKEGSHGFDPHIHCKPTLKDPEDLIAIQRLVYSGCRRVFFGSDSAPHPQSAKECSHCASGVFSSPIALQIITDWWMSDTTTLWWESISHEELSHEERLARLQRFFADNGEALYPRKGEKSVILENIPFTIPASYPTTLSGLDIVPMWAGREIGWSIVG